MKNLKKENPTLYQIHRWILNVANEGWGEIEFTVKAHDYRAKWIDMKAIGNKKKTSPKSIKKRIVIDTKKVK